MANWGAGAQYTRLIEQHGGALLHLAILLTGNRQDAEDIVQDAVISVAAAWPTARPRSGFAYLKRAVSNRSIDYLRSRKEIPVETVPDEARDDLGFLRYEEDKRFFALVDTLPLRQRATLILRYFADMDDRTIAGMLGCSTESVRSQAHHALTKLRASDELVRGRNE